MLLSHKSGRTGATWKAALPQLSDEKRLIPVSIAPYTNTREVFQRPAVKNGTISHFITTDALRMIVI